MKDGKRLLVTAQELFQNQPQFPAQEIQKLTDGFDRLPQAFARSLTEKIKLDESVTRIVQHLMVWKYRVHQGKNILPIACCVLFR